MRKTLAGILLECSGLFSERLDRPLSTLNPFSHLTLNLLSQSTKGMMRFTRR